MYSTIRSVMLGVGVLALVGLAAGCSVDAESNTGIRVNVRYDETVAVGDATGLIDSLRFYVAVRHPEHSDVYILNDAADGIVVDVSDRDLLEDPYQLLIGENGDGDMETIRVVVVGERDGLPVLVGQLLAPPYQTFQSGQIVQRTIWLYPVGQEFDLTWTMTDCLMSSHRPEQGEQIIRFGTLDDLDCDGYKSEEAGGEDCDDTNPWVNPGVVEGHDCDGLDNDCDGAIDPGGHDDFDHDGVSACAGDCDDEDPDVYPHAQEICDGKDNDCNGKCDEGFDNDYDGYTTCNSYLDHDSGHCVWVPTPDCDDQDDAIHPGADEECNGVDDNCNGLCDEGLDPDGDGYTWCGSKSGPPEVDPEPDGDECLEPNPEHEDCAPEDPTVNPGAPEVCDDLDNDCDGIYSTMEANCYVGSGETECWQGQMGCIEDGNGGDLWGSCAGQGQDLAPLAYCGVWPYCAEVPDPDRCMDESIQPYTMSCNLHLYEGYYELCGGNGDRPMYYLPFGFSGMTGCTWHILQDSITSDWAEVGLVSPSDPQAPASTTVLGCEAALVAVPTYANGNPPSTITAIISFHYDNGGGDFYALEMPVTISPVNWCTASYESLVCTI